MSAQSRAIRYSGGMLDVIEGPRPAADEPFQERALLRLGYRVYYKPRGAADSEYLLHTLTAERVVAHRVKRELESMSRGDGLTKRFLWTVEVRRGRRAA